MTRAKAKSKSKKDVYIVGWDNDYNSLEIDETKHKTLKEAQDSVANGIAEGNYASEFDYYILKVVSIGKNAQIEWDKA